MDNRSIRRCGLGRAATVALLAGLLGACADQSMPAPVYLKGGEALSSPAPSMRQVTIQHSQSVESVARFYHVPAAAIIAANGLHPPYAVKAGSRLLIPDAGPAPVRQAAGYGAPAPHVAAVPLPPPPPHPETIALPPGPAATVPAGRQAALTPPQPAAASVQAAPQTVTPPPSAARVLPDIIPLDGPPPKQAAAIPVAPPPAVAARPAPVGATLTPPRGAAPVAQTPAEASVDWSTAETPGSAGGRFPWPVRGRVLANYGGTVGGVHNDGINIAAPRGTPVRAIDSGVVAYAGNEVKGYGNLVLIKHANGWISAYAHLDALSLKPGDKIAAGEVIARVGDSGGVGEPQLHFELRRGKKAVDPKEFLAPAPSAATPAGNKAG
jgi:murein DD-endopeptidase MepM/ murein hydrolase activator NlpD